MSSPKGYSDQKKKANPNAEFSTVNPVAQEQFGLDVNAHIFLREVGTDAVEANSTTTSIVATAHAALRGDVIQITSGALSGKQVGVASISADAINLVEVLDSAPAAAVTFTILRHHKPRVSEAGELSVAASFSAGPIQYVHDGSDVEVELDSGTPADSRPLPVRLLDADGAAVVPATAAAQSTANAALAAIELASEAIQTAVEGVLAVDVMSSILPTGAATAEKQDTAQSSLDAIQTAIEGTLDIAAAALPLPAGAATSAKQDTLSAQIPASLGQKAMAASLAVVVASDQSTLTVSEAASATATSSNVSGSASSVSLLASNTARKGATVFNDSTAVLYLKLGATASTTSYTVQLTPLAYYEVPGKYTGAIDGIWTSATGAARIVELT